jgi:4'-phosphopantetheinyl transferase
MPSAKLSDLSSSAHVAYAYPRTILEFDVRPQLMAALSDDERARYTRFRFDDDRDTYLVAHALTRGLIAGLCGCALADVQFELGERGRPELIAQAGRPALRFNLSHTRGFVACAFTASADIGVDVEYADRKVEILAVAKHVFSARERSALEALSGVEQRERFFDLWTLKEAYVKAIGKGLAAPLRAISFAPEQPDSVPVHFTSEVADNADDWCFRRLKPHSDYRLAVAFRAGRDAAVSFEEYVRAELLAIV